MVGGGLQVGGGVTPENAKAYLDAGASHVIVTSYVFRDGKIDFLFQCNMIKEGFSSPLVKTPEG